MDLWLHLSILFFTWVRTNVSTKVAGEPEGLGVNHPVKGLNRKIHAEKGCVDRAVESGEVKVMRPLEP